MSAPEESGGSGLERTIGELLAGIKGIDLRLTERSRESRETEDRIVRRLESVSIDVQNLERRVSPELDRLKVQFEAQVKQTDAFSARVSEQFAAIRSEVAVVDAKLKVVDDKVNVLAPKVDTAINLKLRVLAMVALVASFCGAAAGFLIKLLPMFAGVH